MASVKQLNMLCAKARAANMDFDRSVSKDLDDEQIDVLVAKFDANGGKQKAEQKETVAPKSNGINGFRFGMVYKIVIDRVGHQWKAEKPDSFIGQVVAEYELATKAEEAVKASSSGFLLRTLQEGMQKIGRARIGTGGN